MKNIFYDILMWNIECIQEYREELSYLNMKPIVKHFHANVINFMQTEMLIS